MNHVEQLQRPARFVGLKMAHEMPARVPLFHLRDLLFGFLNAVFAEVGGAEFDETTYQTRGMRLADRDQPDLFRTAAASLRRRVDTRFYGRKPRGKPLGRVNVCHHAVPNLLSLFLPLAPGKKKGI